MLAITFANPQDYNKIEEDDIIDITGLKEMAPGKTLTVALHHHGGSTEEFPVNHSYNKNQIEWFKAGAALNLFRE